MSSIREVLRDRAAALLGISGYSAAPKQAPSLDDGWVEKLRTIFGGQITPPVRSQSRWFLADLEAAVHAADAGDMAPAARIWRWSRRDGVLAGILATTTRGVTALPRKFDGPNEKIVQRLQGRDGARSLFDALCPPAELVAMAADGRGMGYSFAELVPVKDRAYPVLTRRDPEFFYFRWHENRWYFNSIAGPIPVIPGDGRWVLHVEGSRETPWQAGLWPALGASCIRKTHAQLMKSNWEAHLANPARAAIAPNGATEQQRLGFLDRLIAWGVNTVFELPPGWDVKIIESNGTGHESFEETIDRSDREYMIALASQVMTTDGGEGFSNGDLGENRLEAQIKATCEALAFTLNTQVLPQWTAIEGGDPILDAPFMSWDATPPKDEKKSSEALGAFGQAIATANTALAPYRRRVDALQLARSYGVPLEVVVDDPDSGEGNGSVVSLDKVRSIYGRTGS